MDQTTQPLSVPMAKEHRVSRRCKESITSSDTDTTTTDGESDMPMSGTDVDSDVDSPDEVPGLLNSPVKEAKHPREKKASEDSFVCAYI